MDSSRVQEMKTSPVLLTSTGLLVSTKAVLMNQGRPKHSMSNTFEPTMLDMAMSAFPGGEKGIGDGFECVASTKLLNRSRGLRWFTFSGHHHTGHSVGYTGSSSKQSEAHHSVRDIEGLT